MEEQKNLQAEMDALADSTIYDPEKSTLWISSGVPGDYSLRKIDRAADPNAPRSKEDGDDPRSTTHAMVNTVLVLCSIASFGALVWSTGIIQLFLQR